MNKGYTRSDIMNIALSGDDMSIKKGLKTYANPDNWIQFYDKENCRNLWVWDGPTICAYEHASQCLRYDHSADPNNMITSVNDAGKT